MRTVREAVTLYLRTRESRRLSEIINEQNKDLEAWNENLKKRLLQTTSTIRAQSEALKSFDKKHPVAVLSRAFDAFFETMCDFPAVHARTVSTLVTDAARKMGLDAETIGRFRLAALLHDAGKFSSLSHSPGKYLDEMSENELRDYRQHPLRGRRCSPGWRSFRMCCP